MACAKLIIFFLRRKERLETCNLEIKLYLIMKTFQYIRYLNRVFFVVVI